MNKKVFYAQLPITGVEHNFQKTRVVNLSDYEDVDVYFLSKKGLSKYKEVHKIENAKTIGYTKLKEFKDNKEAVLTLPVLIHSKVNVDMRFSKKMFHRKIGYIPVTTEANKDVKYSSNLFVAVERLSIIPIILLPIIFLMLFCLCFHACNNYADRNITDNHQPVIENHISDTTSDYEYENSAQLGGELPTGKNSIAGTDSIEAALYDANKIYLSKSNQTIDLINSADNTVDFQYFIYSDENNTNLLFSSKLIAPGKYIKWNAYDICASGDTTLYVTVKTFDVGSHKECNGYTTKMYIVK